MWWFTLGKKYIYFKILHEFRWNSVDCIFFKAVWYSFLQSCGMKISEYIPRDEMKIEVITRTLKLGEVY